MSDVQAIQRSSTEVIPPALRYEFWMNTLRQSLWPVSEWKGLQDFKVELREAPLGCLTSMTETISAHESHRTPSDVKRSADRCYLLFANQSPWHVAHNDHSALLKGGECVLVDSQGELVTSAPSGFQGVILKLPVGWLQSWLPEPESLIGERIPRDSKWGQVLSPIVSQLTPELAVTPPLPHGVLVDQLGTVLALIAGDAENRPMPDLIGKIRDCIRQRYSELELTAAHVAASVNLPTRTLHRTLGASDLTFASLLLEARANAALQMLKSLSFAHVSINEISHQAGFQNASHFARVIRKRTGQSPLQLRGLVD